MLQIAAAERGSRVMLGETIEEVIEMVTWEQAQENAEQ